MIESFVDLTYRGIELARRVKLTAVTANNGYLEVATPMPVGTEVTVTTDEQVRFSALVNEIHEQIAGANHAPGMRVTPSLVEADAKSWWAARTTIIDSNVVSIPASPAAASVDQADVAAPASVATAPTAAATMVSATDEPRAPVIGAPSEATRPAPRRSAEILAQVEAESLTAPHDVVDDGRRTVAMDAIDPALIEQLLHGSQPVQNEGEPETDSGPASSNPSAAKKKSKRSKSR